MSDGKSDHMLNCTERDAFRSETFKDSHLKQLNSIGGLTFSVMGKMHATIQVSGGDGGSGVLKDLSVYCDAVIKKKRKKEIEKQTERRETERQIEKETETGRQRDRGRVGKKAEKREQQQQQMKGKKNTS